MSVVGGLALFNLPPAGRGQRGGSSDHGTDRPAVSGPALLRLAPDGSLVGNTRPPGQPQAGPAADAVDGAGGGLSAAEHEQAGGRAQGLSLSAGRVVDRTGQPGLVLGHHPRFRGGRLYIPMAKGFLYLVAIMDWHSRAVLAWRLSNTLGADFCIEALEEALAGYGRPEIFNTDQGCQFTDTEFIAVLDRCGITISMDGKGRCMDNIFIERLWRSLKYEEVYLHAYASVAEAKAGIGAWLSFYNEERQHQSLGYHTPRQIYDEGLWICGRSALPTVCASPASQASSETGEMLAFAHIPTGTTANRRIDQRGFEGKVTSALTAIGADIEIRGDTP